MKKPKGTREAPIYEYSSRKPGGETKQTADAYFYAFPPVPKFEMIEFQNYAHTERALLRVKDVMFDTMACIKSRISFTDAVERQRRKHPEMTLEEDWLKEHSKKIIERTRIKMEELRYLLSFVELPQDCDEICDIAGGSGDVAIALTLKAFLEGRPVRKATIVDPVSDFWIIIDMVIGHMPFYGELKKRVVFEEQTLQAFEIPDRSVVIAKHPCGDLTDDLIGRWLSSSSTELIIMTCCHGKSKDRPARYGLQQSEWYELCRVSDQTSDPSPEKQRQGKRAMLKLDQKRVEYLRSQGMFVDFRSTDQFAKGNVIKVRRGIDKRQ